MSYDLYASIDSRTTAGDPYASTLLDYARGAETARAKHQRLVHDRSGQAPTSYESFVIAPGLEYAAQLGFDRIDFTAFREAFQDLPAAALEFQFTLEKAWLSRDDESFYPTDNPLRKDWVFHIPIVPGSSWKGALRAAAVENLVFRKLPTEQAGQERLQLFHVFGTEKGEDDERETESQNLNKFLDAKVGPQPYDAKRKEWFKRAGLGPEEEGNRRGRLQALPSYLDRMDMDVLNPRNPRTRVGTFPIKMEHAPPTSKAWFSLIYLAFDLIGEPLEGIQRAARNDWNIIGQAIVRMLRLSGFGAKKSAGCGRAANTLGGFRFESTIGGFSTNIPCVTTIDSLASLGDCFPEGA